MLTREYQLHPLYSDIFQACGDTRHHIPEAPCTHCELTVAIVEKAVKARTEQLVGTAAALFHDIERSYVAAILEMDEAQ